MLLGPVLVYLIVILFPGLRVSLSVFIPGGDLPAEPEPGQNDHLVGDVHACHDLQIFFNLFCLAQSKLLLPAIYQSGSAY